MKKIIKNLPSLSKNKNVCISLSGGLDSTVLVYLLVMKYGKDNVKALSFNYGQRHNVELEMANKTADILGISYKEIKLDYMNEMNKEFSTLIKETKDKPKTAEHNSGNPQVDTYISFRNLQFASITASFAETNNCEFIFQGLNAVDEYGYWDTSTQFVNNINEILKMNRENLITFITPFVELYKEDELVIAKEISNEYGFNILENTWSCYNGQLDEFNFLECGECNTCTEKIIGYIHAGYTQEEIFNKFNINKIKYLELLGNV